MASLTSLSRRYVYYKYLTLGIFLWKFLKLLVHGAVRTARVRSLSPPPHLVKSNGDIQRRFMEIFRKYDLCPQCVNHCCQGDGGRLSELDCFLQGRDFAEGSFALREFWELLRRVLTKVGRVARLGRRNNKPSDSPQVVCPKLGEGGCKVDLGARPMVCLEGVCRRMLDAFSRTDLREYSRLCNEYTILKVRVVGRIFLQSLGSVVKSWGLALNGRRERSRTRQR